MLIKIITHNEDVIIIDDVTDVHVHGAVYDYNPSSPETDFPNFNELFFEGSGNQLESTLTRVITYAKDGPCALHVANKAYICNNDGKTIEKVVIIRE